MAFATDASGEVLSYAPPSIKSMGSFRDLTLGFGWGWPTPPPSPQYKKKSTNHDFMSYCES